MLDRPHSPDPYNNKSSEAASSDSLANSSLPSADDHFLIKPKISASIVADTTIKDLVELVQPIAQQVFTKRLKENDPELIRYVTALYADHLRYPEDISASSSRTGVLPEIRVAKEMTRLKDVVLSNEQVSYSEREDIAIKFQQWGDSLLFRQATMTNIRNSRSGLKSNPEFVEDIGSRAYINSLLYREFNVGNESVISFIARNFTYIAHGVGMVMRTLSEPRLA